MRTDTRRRITLPGHADEGFTIVEHRGAADGPTVSILGGVHGDEFEGPVACLRLAEELAGILLRGRVRLVPVAHEAAHVASLRSSPVDGVNLARTFPGDPDGSATQRLADALRRQVIEGSDLCVDLHSAGTAYEMPLLVGWADDGCAACQASARAAAAFAAPVLWRHPGPLGPGRTLSSAHDVGIAGIYAEAAGGGTVTGAHADMYVAGMRRVLVSMGMLDAREATPGPSPRRLVGEGNMDVPSMVAPLDGICEMHVAVLDEVKVGQVVAVVTDPLSGVRMEVASPARGVVVMARRAARVARGDNLVVLAGEEAAAS